MNTIPAIFITSFIIALSGALMPGPLLTTTIAESSRSGPKAGPLIIAGHGILEFALVIVLFSGLAPLLANVKIVASISLAGGAILFWLSYGMLWSVRTVSLAAGTQPHRSRRGRLLASGILVSMANPYWSIWWATIGLAYIVQARRFGAAGVAIFFVGHLLADLAWYSAVSFSFGKGRRFLNDTAYRAIIGACGVFLFVFGIVFIVVGVRRLAGS
jgi:threonine/homoserine/homoserine lactone efflux protein